MHTIIPLNLLAPGQFGEVAQISGRPDEVHRLEELGLRGGAAVEMLQSGSPCIIRLAGQKLCLRADELLSVLVRLGVSS